jgi:hypothetical protein
MDSVQEMLIEDIKEETEEKIDIENFSLLKIINGRHKRRSGRHTLARQKNIQKKKKNFSLFLRAISSSDEDHMPK